MSVIQIGPFTLEGLIFLAVLGFAAAMGAAILYDKKRGGQAEKRLWWLTLVAALTGRLVFVIRFWPSYQEQPLEVINIRDGGFAWQAAVVVYVLALLWLFIRRRVLFAGIAQSIAIGAVVIVGGLIWMQPWKESPQNWYEMSHLEQLRPMSSAVNTKENTVLSADQYHGKPTVINLWATWCPPCRREMPVLQQAQQRYKDVNFVFINQGERPDQIEKFLEEQGLELQNLWLDEYGLSGQAIDSKGLPSTLFLDGQGRIVNARLGELSAASLQSHLESIRIKE
ncbi:MAG TPA: TlpA disulfide reductase family protein [Paenalcaligenes sp.]|nr:TlpA disulfide reductase family protein [Paenalcaligenes sp.]